MPNEETSRPHDSEELCASIKRLAQQSEKLRAEAKKNAEQADKIVQKIAALKRRITKKTSGRIL